LGSLCFLTVPLQSAQNRSSFADPDPIWQDGCTIVAIKPREPFLRYFQTADELAKRWAKKRGVENGSDDSNPRPPA